MRWASLSGFDAHVSPCDAAVWNNSVLTAGSVSISGYVDDLSAGPSGDTAPGSAGSFVRLG